MSHSFRHGKYSRQSKLPYWHWIWAEPKLWRKFAKHRKRRSEVRRLLVQVICGNDAVREETIWPLDKKPWLYYW